MGRINVNLSIFAGLQSPNSSRVLLYAWLPLVVLNGAAWWCLVLPCGKGRVSGLGCQKGLTSKCPSFFFAWIWAPARHKASLRKGQLRYQ